jgi:hypothetical protein
MKSIQQSVTRGQKLPYENSDDAERHSDLEERESTEDHEREESPEDFEKEAREAADDLERREAADRMANDASDELDEMESKSKEVEDHADDDAREPDGFERENENDKEQSMEDELGHDLDEVRDDLHDKYVNDMERQLEEPSTKDVEGEETGEDGTSSEMTESSESYEDAGDGMAYTMETKGETEGHAQSEVENEAEQETQESTESSEPVDETEESYEDKTTNRITKPEHGEEVFEATESRTASPTQEGEARSLSKTESDETMEGPDSEPTAKEPSHQETSEVECSEVEEPESEVSEPYVEEESLSEINDPGTEEATESTESETEPSETSEVKESSEYQQELTEYQDDLHKVSDSEVEEEVESEIPESETSEIEDEELPVETDEIVKDEVSEDITEDFIDRVEELLESFDEPRDESDEQFIVEALTGERVRDRTLEPRSFFGESAENDVEEEIRARFRERFGELTEEEREWFKELVRARLKTEEDLNTLIKRYPSVTLSSDFKQKLKEARSFIKSKKSGKVPRLIRELWVLEIEREWTNVVGEAICQSVERSLRDVLKAPESKLKKKRKSMRKTGYNENTHSSKEAKGLVNSHLSCEEIRNLFLGEKPTSFIERVIPGLKHNRNYAQLESSVTQYYDLLERIEELNDFTISELKQIALELGISFKKAKKWVIEGQKPVTISQVEKALSNRQTASTIKTELGFFKSAEHVRSELEKRQLIEVIDSWKRGKKEWKQLNKFFQFLKLLETGTLTKDIARILNVPNSTLYYWERLHYPYPLFLVIQEKSDRTTVLTKKHRVRIFQPRIAESNSCDFESVHQYISENLPGLLNEPAIGDLLKEAREHLLFIDNVKQLKRISANQLHDIASELGIAYTTARRWCLEGQRPELYGFIERALENIQKTREIRRTLPLKSIDELLKLKNHHFLASYLESWDNSAHLDLMTRRYFDFLDMFETGYTQRAIAKSLHIGEGTIYSWIHGTYPLILHILQEMPHNSLKQGWCWLPMVMDGRVLKEYIEVPRTVKSFNDIIEVVNQLNEKPGSIEDFMYLFGILLSDGYAGLRGKSSASFRLLLGQSYPWSKQIIDSTQDILELFGFETYSHEVDRLNAIELSSQTTPFFLWVRSSVLGLRKRQKKTYVPLKGSWIIDASEKSRTAFLQGLADGDGHASVISQEVGIASVSNQSLISALLQSFGVKSHITKTGVLVRNKESILRLGSLPLFRHATSRRLNLKELVNMMLAKTKRRNCSKMEKEFILRLHDKDMSYGRIAYELWKTHGIARSPSALCSYVARQKENRTPKS